MIYIVADITADGPRLYYSGSDFSYATQVFNGNKMSSGYYHLKLFLVDLRKEEVRVLAEERAKIL